MIRHGVQTPRTSESHPLQIASVSPAPDHGLIGVTFCPGKKQRLAATGAWDRDLCIDVEAIAAGGAASVLTLLEPHELEALSVSSLGEEVRRRHMDWYHLPIVDVNVPCERFEDQWQEVGEVLRAQLRSGFNIIVHCKGGLGRAGTIAARLMIELGAPADEAIGAVRQARPGAIETAAQVAYVRSTEAAPEATPSLSLEYIQDRAVGALLGLAVGDAIGTTLEFRSRDSYTHLTDMIGGGPFRLAPGQWTDDTAMALALAESLLAAPGLDETDLMSRFIAWRDKGSYSCTGTCFDIGMTVSAALNKFRSTGNPVAGSSDPMSAGNGSLMRLSPVAIRFWNDPGRRADVAGRQSATTHGAPEAVDACIAYADILADAIAGKPRSKVLAPRANDFSGAIRDIIGGSWRGKRRDQIASTGYVAHSLEAALWSIGRTGSFKDAVLTAANLGGDADTTAAIAGQLAGALYGRRAIPAEWLERLAWQDQICKTAPALFYPAD